MEDKYKKRLEKYENAAKKFWAEEYPQKTNEEKLNYWSGSIHQQMRWNGESGFDEMAVFSKADYELWKEKEPLIDEILVHVIKRLNLNSKKVLNALKS